MERHRPLVDVTVEGRDISGGPPLVSFYDSDSGGEMLTKVGAHGLSDLAARLDGTRRQVLADLLGLRGRLAITPLGVCPEPGPMSGRRRVRF